MLRNCMFFTICCSLLSFGQTTENNNSDPTEILILGTLHFNQFHNESRESTNFKSKERQVEFLEVINKLNDFKPDAVFIEREPSKQSIIDSLYKLQNVEYYKLNDGLSEVYQIGFKLAKINNIKTVHGVDYYESIPQNLLNSGNNIELFENALGAFQNKGRTITKRFLGGAMSVNEFLIELNKKENVDMSHRLLFNTPAYVTDGAFKSNKGYNCEDCEYVGAEYISLFYKRNLKIYTNILNAVKRNDSKRVVLIIGQVHVEVLQEIIGNNPNFKVIESNSYLKF